MKRWKVVVRAIDGKIISDSQHYLTKFFAMRQAAIDNAAARDSALHRAAFAHGLDLPPPWNATVERI
jgi:CMP-N-acetylneuraminic acid synthetase